MRSDAPNSAVVQSQKVPAAEISVKRVSVTDVADGRVPGRHFRSRAAAACSAQLTAKDRSPTQNKNAAANSLRHDGRYKTRTCDLHDVNVAL